MQKLPGKNKFCLLKDDQAENNFAEKSNNLYFVIKNIEKEEQDIIDRNEVYRGEGE